VRDESGGYHAQMAVLVKPNGPLGTAYMAAIKPFRHLIVYPALMQRIAQDHCGFPSAHDQGGTRLIRRPRYLTD
jgi:hypothetical protein